MEREETKRAAPVAQCSSVVDVAKETTANVGLVAMGTDTVPFVPMPFTDMHNATEGSDQANPVSVLRSGALPGMGQRAKACDSNSQASYMVGSTVAIGHNPSLAISTDPSLPVPRHKGGHLADMAPTRPHRDG